MGGWKQISVVRCCCWMREKDRKGSLTAIIIAKREGYWMKDNGCSSSWTSNIYYIQFSAAVNILAITQLLHSYEYLLDNFHLPSWTEIAWTAFQILCKEGFLEAARSFMKDTQKVFCNEEAAKPQKVTTGVHVAKLTCYFHKGKSPQIVCTC